MAQAEGYKNIFKSTFLFGFVQVFNIAVKVVLNKIAAILLGPSGMGIIGLFNNSTSMLQTGCGLGIPQSAVRDISEANSQDNYDRFSLTISVTNKIVLFTAFLGVAVTIILSPLLSQWAFGSNQYILSYILLSLCVGFSIMTEGKLAVLKGMRRLRHLAKASMLGSILGLLIAVPFYYFLGTQGIAPAIVTLSLGTYIVAEIYVRKIRYNRIKTSFRRFWTLVKNMVKMGCSLMLVSFISLLFSLAVSAYISYSGSLSDVGLYQAGVTIISSYFGIVITAMSTEYYPRISAVCRDNGKLQDEMNRQSEVGLIMIFPLVVLFIFLSSFFIQILYDSSFEKSNDYTNYALLGTIIILVSNSMGMILLAKQASQIFLLSVITQRLILLGVYFLLYSMYGLLGLGFAYIFTGVLHISLMSAILKKFYGISLNKRVISLLALILSVAILMILIRTINSVPIRYSAGTIGIIFSLAYSLYYMRAKLDIDLITIIKNKIHR